MGAPTGSPAPPVHRHTSHHTHHPLSARLPPPHKLRRLPPTSARQTRRKRKKEKTSAPPSEGTPPIQEEGGAGVDEEEEEEEEEGESEAEPAEPPPPGSPTKAKVGTPEVGLAAQGGARRGGEAWQLGVGAESGHGPKAHTVYPQFSIGSDEDDSPSLSGRAAFTKPLPSVGPSSDKSPQHSVRYRPLAQPSAGPRLLPEPQRRSWEETREAGRGGRQGVPLLCTKDQEGWQGQSSRRERVSGWRGEWDKEDLGTCVIGLGRWR